MAEFLEKVKIGLKQLHDRVGKDSEDCCRDQSMGPERRNATDKTPGCGANTCQEQRASSTVYTVFPDIEAGVQTTMSIGDETFGTVIYPELPDGQYKLVETKQPAGYVKNEVNDAYFDIVNGVLTRYRTPYSGEARNAEDAISETKNVALVTYHLESEDPDLYATFTIGNTPGVALPSTGGSGTAWLKILGMVLVATGGTGIVLQRKRHYRG